MEFTAWLAAVASQAMQFWCGVVCVVISLVEWVTGKDIGGKLFRSRVWLLVVGAILLIWANYAAWSDEHNKVLALTDQPPAFTAGVDGYVPLPMDKQTLAVLYPFKFAVLLQVWVENDGSPSVVHEWYANGVNMKGARIPGRVLVPPSTPHTFQITDEDGTRELMTIQRSHSLLIRSASRVDKYDRISGDILVGFLKPVRLESIRLGFTDRLSHFYHVYVTKESPVPTP